MKTTKRNLIQTWLLCAAMLQAVTSGAQTVTKVAGGWQHSLFVKSDGSLWAMGFNRDGELGDGTYCSVNGIGHTRSHKKRPNQPPILLDLS